MSQPRPCRIEDERARASLAPAVHVVPCYPCCFISILPPFTGLLFTLRGLQALQTKPRQDIPALPVSSSPIHQKFGRAGMSWRGFYRPLDFTLLFGYAIL